MPAGTLVRSDFMAIEWSGLSPELLVRLDRSAGQPLRAQLEVSLRDAIRSGRLRAGERLPSSRELAREIGVSRGMVQDCYAQLLSEGYLTSRTGSATRVAGLGDPGDQHAATPAAPPPPPPPGPWATATRAAARCCARSSPGTCGGSGPPPPARRG